MKDSKKYTAYQIAVQIVRQTERAYDLIRDQVDRLTREQMTFGEDAFRDHERGQLNAIAEVLRAQRESLRSLAWMIQEEGKDAEKEREFADLMRDLLFTRDYDSSAMQIKGWLFRSTDPDGKKEEIIRANIRKGE